MLARYAGKIAVVMPYATFGYPIDLERYKSSLLSSACLSSWMPQPRWARCDVMGEDSGVALPEALCFPCTQPSLLL